MESTRKQDVCSLIRFLPKELRDMIQKEYLQVALRPGKVYPEESAGIGKAPSNGIATRPGVIEELQIQDASMGEMARDIFYCQNTWVVSEGALSAVEFLTQPRVPVFDVRRIISVDMSFSRKDAYLVRGRSA
ncbi:hypothetical protein MMC34_005404 [Xylographa carneopallida]|nr:hypothetical protein [Xylographa carneopallida]